LFDVRLVHEVLNDRNHATVIIIAGGTHIKKTFDALVSIGYKRVPMVQECLMAENATGRGCFAQLGAVKQRLCALPRPVSLTCCEHFLP